MQPYWQVGQQVKTVNCCANRPVWTYVIMSIKMTNWQKKDMISYMQVTLKEGEICKKKKENCTFQFESEDAGPVLELNYTMTDFYLNQPSLFQQGELPVAGFLYVFLQQ